MSSVSVSYCPAGSEWKRGSEGLCYGLRYIIVIDKAYNFMQDLIHASPNYNAIA